MELKVRATYTRRAEVAVKQWYDRVKLDFRETEKSRPELVISKIYPNSPWDEKNAVILELDLNDGTAPVQP